MQAVADSDLVPPYDSGAVPVTSKRSAAGEVMVLEVTGLGQPELGVRSRQMEGQGQVIKANLNCEW